VGARALAVILLAAACTSPGPSVATPTPTAEPGVVSVTALLDLSGPRASVGAQQRNALQLWTEQHPRATPPVRLKVVDVAGSDARLLIELKRAATEDLADAVIVGAPVVYDDTFGRAVDLAALPVMLAQPVAADPAGRAGGRWAFALAPSLARLAAALVDDAVRRGVLVPSLALSDARDRVDPVTATLAAELEKRDLEPLTRITIGTDGTIPPVVRSSLSVLRSVQCFAPLPVCAAIAREARSSGSPLMLYLPYGTSTNDQLKDDRDLALRAVWPSSRTLIPPTVLRTDEDHARAAFAKDYSARFGARPDIHAAIAYDALSLLADAAGRAGADDRGAQRDALERITIPLIASTYTFAQDRHAGPDGTDVAYLRWDLGAPALAPLFGTVAPTPTPSPAPARTASPSPSATR